jgi:hypothetical protein
MSEPSVLTAADVEAIARRVAELLRHESWLSRHVDTMAVAAMLGVSGEWVRDHAAELGAVRVGDGARGALRFDVKRVQAALDQRRLERPGRAPRCQPGPKHRRHGVELLPLPSDAL